jgi:hypothetical protein
MYLGQTKPWGNDEVHMRTVRGQDDNVIVLLSNRKEIEEEQSRIESYQSSLPQYQAKGSSSTSRRSDVPSSRNITVR